MKGESWTASWSWIYCQKTGLLYSLSCDLQPRTWTPIDPPSEPPVQAQGPLGKIDAWRRLCAFHCHHRNPDLCSGQRYIPRQWEGGWMRRSGFQAQICHLHLCDLELFPFPLWTLVLGNGLYVLLELISPCFFDCKEQYIAMGRKSWVQKNVIGSNLWNSWGLRKGHNQYSSRQTNGWNEQPNIQWLNTVQCVTASSGGCCCWWW